MRSSSGAFSPCSCGIELGGLPGLGIQELDVVLDQVRVEVLELFLGELDLLERRRHLVVRQIALFLTLLNQPLQLFNFRERDLDGQHGRPREGRGWDGWNTGNSQAKNGNALTTSLARWEYVERRRAEYSPVNER